ncbi:MAG: hypothetical protein ACRDRJ_27685 [Streptosporangiaceae bacterium]
MSYDDRLLKAAADAGLGTASPRDCRRFSPSTTCCLLYCLTRCMTITKPLSQPDAAVLRQAGGWWPLEVDGFR